MSNKLNIQYSALSFKAIVLQMGMDMIIALAVPLLYLEHLSPAHADGGSGGSILNSLK